MSAGATLKRSHFSVYEVNRRSTVTKGTREASAVANMNDGSVASRAAAEKLARQRATEIWVDKWGELPIDRLEVIVWHLSFEVLVAVRDVV